MLAKKRFFRVGLFAGGMSPSDHLGVHDDCLDSAIQRSLYE